MNKKNTRIASFNITKPIASAIAIVTIAAQLFFPLASIAATISPVPAANPVLANSCGIDVALVLDNSTSIDSGELAQMKTAFHGFVDSLSVAPTQFSVTNFNTTAAVKQAFISNPTIVNNAIDTIATTSNGSTNWEDGLIKAASTFDPRPLVPNLIVFASDGNPNKYGNGGRTEGPGNGFDQTSLDKAVAEANLIKGQGTRIITLGIGNASGSDALNPANLKAISGDDAYYNADNFGALAFTLQTMATDLCGGTITARKVMDRDGDLNTVNDQSAGVNWSLNVAGVPQTTDAEGKTQSVDVNGSGPFSVSETAQSNYAFITAGCINTNHNDATVGVAGNGEVTGINLTDKDIVTCTFYNRPAAANLTVKKHVINDTDSVQGALDLVASDFNLNVKETIGSGAPFDVATFFGSEDGTPVAVDGDSHYVVSETNPGAYSVSYSPECSGLMPANGSVTCTVTNDDLEDTVGSLTVVKIVVNDNGGTALVNDYALAVTDASSTAAVFTSGQAQLLIPGDYKVAESGGKPGYSATFTGDCDSSGNVSVAAGQSRTCFITNDDIQPKLTVVKEVVGGTKPAGDFPLFVTDSQSNKTQVASGVAAGFNAGTYTVSETSADDYTASYSQNCANGQITLAVGQADPTCVITNTYVAPAAQQADIALTKAVDLSSVKSGQQVNFTIKVVNNGPAAAAHVVVDDVMPAGLAFVSDVVTAGTYDFNLNKWTVGALANGASETLNIAATATGTEGARLVNTVSVTIDPTVSIDPNAGNDTASATVTIASSGNGGGGSVLSGGGSNSSNSSSGQFINGPHGVTPQALGASINLDDIAAAIARIRAAIASLAQEIAGMHLPSVLGAATMVSTGVLDN